VATLVALIPMLTFLAMTAFVLVALSIVQRWWWVDETDVAFVAVLSAKYNMLLYTWLSMLTLAAMLLVGFLVSDRKT